MVVGQVQAAFQQRLVPWQEVQQPLRIGPQAELLIGHDEEDVQRLVRVTRRAGPGAHGRGDAGGGADAGQTGQKGTTIDPGHVSLH
ncbi:hypothetical protein D3C80_1626910 [compost metagenome]